MNLLSFRPFDQPGSALLLLVLALGGTGCATTYRFTIDAVQHPAITPAPMAYVVVNRTPPGSVGELAFDRAVRDVRTALSSKGLFEAPAGVAPELEVEIDFGVEAPVQNELTHTEPVYVCAPPAAGALGRAGAEHLGAAALPRKIGDRAITSFVTVYPKFLRLTARATPSRGADQPGKVCWSVVVKNQDESNNLDRYVPLMAAAAMDAIADDSAGQRQILLTKHDHRVVFVERGM